MGSQCSALVGAPWPAGSCREDSGAAGSVGQWAGDYSGHTFMPVNLSLSGSLCVRPGALPLLGGEPDRVPDPQRGQPPRLGHCGEVVHGATAGSSPSRVRSAGRSDDGMAAGCARPRAPLPSLPSLLSSLLPSSLPSFLYSSFLPPFLPSLPPSFHLSFLPPFLPISPSLLFPSFSPPSLFLSSLLYPLKTCHVSAGP